MEKRKTIFFSARIDAELHRRFKRHCVEHCESIQDVLERVLSDYLELADEEEELGLPKR